MDTIENHTEELHTKLNRETAKIAWKELQRFFASGAVLKVSSDLDLVDVGFQMSEDNADQIRQWMLAGKLGRVSDEQAAEWLAGDELVWGVVVSPWLLVQSSVNLH